MKNILLYSVFIAPLFSLAQNPVTNNLPYFQSGQVQNKPTDTSKLTKKTVSHEISLTKPMDVLIDMTGDLIINTWNNNQVKIETTVQFEGQNELTDVQWLEKLNVNLKIFGSTVQVKSKPPVSYSQNSFGLSKFSNNAAIYYGDGFMRTGITGSHNPVTVFIPSTSVLEIDCERGSLTIKNDIKSLSLTNNGSQVTCSNIDKLQLRGTQVSFNGGTVNEADIQLAHSRLSLKQLTKGDLTASYSTIEIESVKEVKLNSRNDEIDIDNAGAVYGIKYYGNLRINQLSGRLELQGVNSDVRLRKISSTAQLVKLSSRNADLRLSARDLANFSVDIKGSYNTTYSSFNDKILIDTLTTSEKESVKSMMNTISANSLTSEQKATLASTGRLQFNTGNGVSTLTVAGRGTLQNTGQEKNQPNEAGQRIPYLKQSVQVGDAAIQFKYQIICTSCVIDFK